MFRIGDVVKVKADYWYSSRGPSPAAIVVGGEWEGYVKGEMDYVLVFPDGERNHYARWEIEHV